MLIGCARGAPLFEVGPAPSDGARAQVHGTRERAGGDQAVDGRSAKAGGLNHRGQAREQARRVGGAAGGGWEAIHVSRRASDVRSLGAVVALRRDGLVPRIIDQGTTQFTGERPRDRRWNRPRFQQEDSPQPKLRMRKRSHSV